MSLHREGISMVWSMAGTGTSSMRSHVYFSCMEENNTVLLLWAHWASILLNLNPLTCWEERLWKLSVICHQEYQDDRETLSGAGFLEWTTFLLCSWQEAFPFSQPGEPSKWSSRDRWREIIQKRQLEANVVYVLSVVYLCFPGQDAWWYQKHTESHLPCPLPVLWSPRSLVSSSLSLGPWLGNGVAFHHQISC